MTDYELNFSLKIEEMLSGIADPVYRCLVVEVGESIDYSRCTSVVLQMFEAINVLLKRNSELRFIQTLDVDYLIHEAVKLFQQQTVATNNFPEFSNLPMTLVCGSTGYMIRAIINHLFNANVQKSDAESNTDNCKIS